MANFGITRVVDVTLTRVAGVAGLLSFDIPLLITNETPNSSFGASNRAKLYTSADLSAVGTDFGTSTEVYKAANKLLSQSPTVSKFYIAKRSTPVAIVKDIDWSGDFASGDVITWSLNGDSGTVNWSSDQSTTMGLLNTALAAAYGVDTSTGTTNTNTVTADAEYPLDITISAAGGNAPTATITTDTAGTRISDDLDAALAEVSTAHWYAIYNCQTNNGAHLTAAAWTEAQTKLYFGQTSDAAVITNATDDIVSRLQDSAYTRSNLTYRGTTTDHAPAALIGRCLAVDPGQITFGLKKLSGVTADTLTAAQIGFVEGKSGNTYNQIANQGCFLKGVALDGNAIEVWRDLDYLVNALNEALLAAITTNDKVPYTETGLKFIESTGQAVINRMVTEGILDGGNGDGTNGTTAPPRFTVPALADISEADKTARLLSGCKVIGTYAGAVIKVEVAATINLT